MKVLVVDDEAPARSRLKGLLEALPGIRVAGEAADGESALTAARELAPDVVLLDIRMPGMDGMAAARKMAELPHPPTVIFTTAYGDHALEAFEAQALDYLLKPIRRERLEKALARVQPIAATAGDYLFSRVHGRELRVPVAEVRYFHAGDKYVSAHYDGGEALLEESLKALEERFGESFVRVHRNALVARAWLAGIVQGAEGSSRILLQGGQTGPEISRRHLPEVRRLLKGE